MSKQPLSTTQGYSIKLGKTKPKPKPKPNPNPHQPSQPNSTP